MKIRWTEDHDFGGLDGDWREIPSYAIYGEPGSRIIAAVIMEGLRKLREPIWIFPITAHQLAAQRILYEFATDGVDEDLLLYPADGEEYLLQLYVGPA